jgi:hypothetical protein
MDAYRKGLSVKKAAWYVKKQNNYRVISEALIKEFDIQPEGALKKGINQLALFLNFVLTCLLACFVIASVF